MVDFFDDYALVNNPKHYQCPFKVKPLTCDFFFALMPSHLANAFKYTWRAGRKPGVSLRLDLRKALESLRLWDDVDQGWAAIAGADQAYPNQLYLQHAYAELLSDATEVVTEQWRMDALEAIVFGRAAGARAILETKLEEVLRDETV